MRTRRSALAAAGAIAVSGMMAAVAAGSAAGLFGFGGGRPAPAARPVPGVAAGPEPVAVPVADDQPAAVAEERPTVAGEEEPTAAATEVRPAPPATGAPAGPSWWDGDGHEDRPADQVPWAGESERDDG